MGRRGPKPKPTAIKKFEGNPGKRPLNKHEPDAPPLVTLTPPKWLGTVARAKFTELAPRLSKMGVLSEIDVDHFALLCDAWQRRHDAQKVLDDEGPYLTTDKGFVVQHPAMNVLAKSIELIRKLNADFGLNPSARSSLSLPGDKKPKGKLSKYV